MALIDELKEMREEAKAGREMQEAYVIAHQSNMDEWTAKLADLDTAIAALEPAPAEPVAPELQTNSGESHRGHDPIRYQYLPDPEPSLVEEAEPAEPTDETRYPTADDEAIFTSALFKSAKRIDEPTEAEPAYVGLNDPELDTAWDEMKRREQAEARAKTPHAPFWQSLMSRKLEPTK